MTDPDRTLDRLAAANPVTSDRVDGAHRSTQAERLLAEIVAGRRKPSVGPGRVGNRTRWIVSAAAVLVLVVSISVAAQQIGERPASAQELLLRTANVAAARRAPSADGTYIYTNIRKDQINTSREGGATWSVVVPSVEEAWVARDGSGRLRSVIGEFRFLGPRDRERWEASGRPDIPSGASDDIFPPGSLAYVDTTALPTDTAPLTRALEEDVASQNVPEAVAVFLRTGELLARSDAPPALRAALYRVASRLPGVELIGETTDPEGRTGVAVGMTYEESGSAVRVLMVFEPDTSVLLAQERILLEPASWVDASPGTRLSFVAYLASGRTDSVDVVPPDAAPRARRALPPGRSVEVHPRSLDGSEDPSVPDARHGQDDLGGARVGLDLRAEPPDEDPEQVDVVRVGIAPDVLEQPATRERLAGMLRERFQEVPLGVRQVDRHAGSHHGARLEIDLEVVGPKPPACLGASRAVSLPRLRGDPCVTVRQPRHPSIAPVRAWLRRMPSLYVSGSRGLLHAGVHHDQRLRELRELRCRRRRELSRSRSAENGFDRCYARMSGLPCPTTESTAEVPITSPAARGPRQRGPPTRIIGWRPRSLRGRCFR
jgi:hypothetical protein